MQLRGRQDGAEIVQKMGWTMDTPFQVVKGKEGDTADW